MRYTSMATAMKAMDEMNAVRGFAPAAVYHTDEDGGYFTVIRSWSHPWKNRRGLSICAVILTVA